MHKNTIKCTGKNKTETKTETKEEILATALVDKGLVSCIEDNWKEDVYV